MKSFISSMAASFIADMQEMKQLNKQKLEEIYQKWEESKNFPRKKKKRVRKDLLLSYSIFKHFETMQERYGF